jgi:hypothetical protein
MARRPRSFYAGLSFRPPQPVAAAAGGRRSRWPLQPAVPWSAGPSSRLPTVA